MFSYSLAIGSMTSFFAFIYVLNQKDLNVELQSGNWVNDIFLCIYFVWYRVLAPGTT